MFAPLFWNIGLTEDIPGDVLNPLIRLRDTSCHLHLSASFKNNPKYKRDGSRHPRGRQSDRTGRGAPQDPAKAGFCLTVMEDPSHAET